MRLLKRLFAAVYPISLPNCRQGIDAPKGRQVLISVGEGVLVSSWGGGRVWEEGGKVLGRHTIQGVRPCPQQGSLIGALYSGSSILLTRASLRSLEWLEEPAAFWLGGRRPRPRASSNILQYCDRKATRNHRVAIGVLATCPFRLPYPPVLVMQSCPFRKPAETKLIRTGLPAAGKRSLPYG